jgi:hypothetical protein
MRRSATAALVLALLLHPIAEGLGAASVLCIGADGHVENEPVAQACNGCEEDAPAPTEAPCLQTDDVCCACLDLPIPGGTGSSGTPAPQKPVPTLALTAPLPAPLRAAPPASAAAAHRVPTRAADPSRIGTVVLRC